MQKNPRQDSRTFFDWPVSISVRAAAIRKALFGHQTAEVTRKAVDTFSYKSLPNIKSMKLELGAIDPVVLSSLGYKSRLFPARLEFEPWINGRINKYLLKKFKTLKRYAEAQDGRFWQVANTLMQSNSYLVSGLYAVQTTWHRKKSLSAIQNVLFETRILNKNTFSGQSISYNRIWIPKPGSQEERPINVPRLSARIHMRMLTDILNVWFEAYNSDSQHGFRSQKGTSTAWNAILSKLNEPNIYEFDFRKFFDSINLTYLEQTLISQGMPEVISKALISSLRSQPQNSSAPILNWKDDQEKAITYHYYLKGEYSKEIDVKSTLASMSLAIASDSKKGLKDYYYGVPQGFNHSPSLSTISLLSFLLHPKNSDHVIQYADDGIIFHSNAESLVEAPEASGITIKATASRWIKQNGVWLHPLKFLGLTYNPETATLHTSSRSGKHEGYTLSDHQLSTYFESAEFKSLLRSYGIDFVGVSHSAEISAAYNALKSELTEEATSPDWKHPSGIAASHESILHYSIMGKLTSLLYNGGEANLSEILQDFHYSYVTGSWSDLENIRMESNLTRSQPHYLSGQSAAKLTTFNSSSYANHYVCEWLKNHPSKYKSLSSQLAKVAT